MCPPLHPELIVLWSCAINNDKTTKTYKISEENLSHTRKKQFGGIKALRGNRLSRTMSKKKIYSGRWCNYEPRVGYEKRSLRKIKSP